MEQGSRRDEKEMTGRAGCDSGRKSDSSAGRAGQGAAGVRGAAGSEASTWRALLSLRDPDAWMAARPPATVCGGDSRKGVSWQVINLRHGGK